MDTISEITLSVPGLSSWSFISLCLVNFFTSLVSASFGLGGGTMLVAIIPVHGVIQINSNLVRAMILRTHIKFIWVLPFVIGSIVGVTLASQILFAIPRNIFQGIIGLFILYSL